MPILAEFFIIIVLFMTCGLGLYGFVSLFLKHKNSFVFNIAKYICMMLVLVLLFAHFLLPDIASKYFNSGAILKTLSPKWLPSDQPDIVRLSKEQKYIMYAAQSNLFTNMALSNIKHFPKLTYNYFTIDKNVSVVDKYFFGISVDPIKNNIIDILPKLKMLGIKSVLVRLNYKPDLFASVEYKKTLEAIALLRQSGYDTLLVIAQNRDMFENEKNLQAFTDKIFQDFGVYVNEFQIGATINRPKWGVVKLGEYENFYNVCKRSRDNFAPKAKLIAPSIIDFEWLPAVYYANAINQFDILNSLLYVDRVGYPENTQMGADTIDKIKLLSAIAPNKPFYITEFNWPLSNTGDYKPTSEQEAVNEFLQACYNIRYSLLAIGSHQVSKLYYWQLMANGYGLIDHLTLEAKPSFLAYRAMVAAFSGTSNTKLSKINEKCYSLKAEKNGTVEAKWCIENTSIKVEENASVKYYDMFGAQIKNPVLGVAPIYIRYVQ